MTEPTDTPQYRPTTDQVAALLISRTRGSGGTEVGVFSDDTSPTDTQVEEMITTAVGEIEAEIGVEIPDSCDPLARTVVVYRTCMFVELSKFQEQVSDSTHSAIDYFERLYDKALLSLQRAVDLASARSDGGTGAVNDFRGSHTFDTSEDLRAPGDEPKQDYRPETQSWRVPS